MATTRGEIYSERTREPRVVDESAPTAWKASQVTYFVLAIVQVFLLFRFAFLLFGADPNNGFVRVIYGVTSPLIAPFQGIFPTPVEGGAIFDTATLLAMVVYALVAYLIVRMFFVASDGTTRTDRETRIDREIM
jgi:uncharacterized protein YggT (Ycf19 family)